MKPLLAQRGLSRREALGFVWINLNSILSIFYLALIRPNKISKISFQFTELYSKLWDFAEHSISHYGFNLPSALGSGPAHQVNNLLSNLYGQKYASLSFGAGALLTLLTAVLPKLQPSRNLILFDDVCHQSTIGGIIFGRWKAVRLPRTLHPKHGTVLPLTFEHVQASVEQYGAKKFAAIILVLPSYDGFKSPKEDLKIYAFAKAHGITVIVDGAWDAVRFRRETDKNIELDNICDVWITSPHKRGLTPSSLGCILTNNEKIARLWDEALDLGFRSSSVSFVEIMIAEHRLQQVVSGNWDQSFSAAEQSARELRNRIGELHPQIYIIEPEDVQAETTDLGHILINTSRIPNFDARVWAHTLSTQFDLDVEKATASTLLLLCASPDHAGQLNTIIRILQAALNLVLTQSQNKHQGELKNE